MYLHMPGCCKVALLLHPLCKFYRHFQLYLWHSVLCIGLLLRKTYHMHSNFQTRSTYSQLEHTEMLVNLIYPSIRNKSIEISLVSKVAPKTQSFTWASLNVTDCSNACYAGAFSHSITGPRFLFPGFYFCSAPTSLRAFSHCPLTPFTINCINKVTINN